MRICFFALFVLFSAGSIQARDLFVNNVGGDDRNDGGLELSRAYGGSLATIARALKLAQPGDRIVLTDSGVPYHETISLSSGKHSGIAGRPFVIEGRGAVLDGSLRIPPDAWQHDRDEVFRFSPPSTDYQQLFASGKPLTRRHLLSGEGTLPKLNPLEWCLHHGAIYFRPEHDKLPRDYDLSYAALQTGVTLYHVHDIEIHNLVVQGFRLDGINAHDGLREGRLIGVKCQGNGRSGIAAAGSSHCQVIGSTISGNGTAQIYTEGLAVVGVGSSQVLDDTAPPFVQHGGKLYVDGQPVVGEP